MEIALKCQAGYAALIEACNIWTQYGANQSDTVTERSVPLHVISANPT